MFKAKKFSLAESTWADEHRVPEEASMPGDPYPWLKEHSGHDQTQQRIIFAGLRVYGRGTERISRAFVDWCSQRNIVSNPKPLVLIVVKVFEFSHEFINFIARLKRGQVGVFGSTKHGWRSNSFGFGFRLLFNHDFQAPSSGCKCGKKITLPFLTDGCTRFVSYLETTGILSYTVTSTRMATSMICRPQHSKNNPNLVSRLNRRPWYNHLKSSQCFRLLTPNLDHALKSW